MTYICQLMWMAFLGQLGSSLSHLTFVIGALFFFSFPFFVPFFFLFALNNDIFSAPSFQELCKVQGIWRWCSAVLALRTLPLTLSVLAHSICIPSFLRSSVPSLAMRFTLVPGSIENTVFPLFFLIIEATTWLEMEVKY